VESAIERTKNNTGLVLNFALNYGSHAEIVDAVKTIVRKVQEQELVVEEVTEQVISQHLMCPSLPDPDLLIRTGGELRLSNFMLWQLAYTELYFSEEYWPDFDEQSLRNAIQSFAARQRRYGGLEKGSEKS
jgi:undecaprenyl diphosphate synthase